MMKLRPLFLFSAIFFLAGSALEAREIARRAPLNIIPKPTDVVAATDRKARMRSRDESVLPKLAPGGLNLKRPIRNVAALPGGQGLVQVGSLSVLEETDIGLNAALAPDMWQNSRMSEVSRHFSRLQTSLALPSAYSLAKDLLLSRASPPPGVSDGESFFAMRLHNLLRFGDADSVLRLVDMTGADNRNADVVIAATEARLSKNEIDAACRGMTQFNRLTLTRAQAAYVLKLRGFCQLAEGNLPAASLTLELANETGIKDALFSDILFSATAEIDFARREPSLGGPVSALIGALMLLVEAEIYDRDIAFLPVAMTDGFLAAGHLPPDLKLQMAEFRLNRVFGYEDVYRRLVNEFTASVTAPPDGSVHGEESLEPGEGGELVEIPTPAYRSRAEMFKTLTHAAPETDPYEILYALLNTGSEKNVWPGVVRTLAPALAASRPDVNNVAYADKIIPALLWLDEIAAAQIWQTALLEGNSGFPTALTRRMQGLIRIAGYQDTRTAPTTAELVSEASLSDDMPATRGLPPTETMLLGAVLETGTDSEKAYAMSEIAMLPVLDFEVPPFLGETLQPVEDARLRQMLDLIRNALENERPGEVVLHSLAAISHQSQTEFNMLAMQKILLALKDIGLRDRVRRMALEVLVLQAVSLPQS